MTSSLSFNYDSLPFITIISFREFRLMAKYADVRVVSTNR